MLDKYFVQVDADLFRRFVEAIERIAPPVAVAGEKQTPTTEDDVISLDDDELARKTLQWQLDDLVETLTASGAEANKEEIEKIVALKARLADPDNQMERDVDD